MIVTDEDLKNARPKFAALKAESLRKGIRFELTFEQWLAVWQESGFWHMRGNGVGKYSLARIAPAIGFVPGNVHVIPRAQACAIAAVARKANRAAASITRANGRLTNANTPGTLTKLFDEPARPGSMDFKKWPSLGACGGRR